MIDIYNRDPSDPGYKEGQLEVNDRVEMAIGQIKMLLLTNKGEVLGDPSFGMGLDALLFEMDLSEDSIREQIKKHIFTYAPEFSNAGGTFEVKFQLGTKRDIGLFDFYLPVAGERSDIPVISLKVF